MARLAGGERSAFEALYTALRPRAIRLAQMRVGAANRCNHGQQLAEKLVKPPSHSAKGLGMTIGFGG